MTYSDIYTKFLIEYDKQNITSSYPSLTVYEIATLLDKAYLALIAQKLTGNNPRRAPFEIDIKAIEDLRPLIKTVRLIEDETPLTQKNTVPSNVLRYKFYRDDLEHDMPPQSVDINLQSGLIGTMCAVYSISEGVETPCGLQNDYLYYVSSKIVNDKYGPSDITTPIHTDPIKLVNHEQAQNFFASSVNIPWIKTPMAYIEDNRLYVIIDPFVSSDPEEKINEYTNVYLTYISKPRGFIAKDDAVRFNTTSFELNDSMAEELINLAIVMALETIESPRIQTKEQTRALES